MERQLLERMVGAGVLVAALVVIGPAILDGNQPADPDTASATSAGEELQTHTVRLAAPAPPARAVSPEPAQLADVANEATPAAPAAPAVVQPLPPAVPEAKPAAQSAARPPVPARLDDRAVIPESAADARSARTAATAGAGWYVQVGTFGQRDNADRLAGKLSSLGFASLISSTAGVSKPLHRVRVGPAASRAEAEALAARLAAAGHRGQIVAP
jgi:DedD protein